VFIIGETLEISGALLIRVVQSSGRPEHWSTLKDSAVKLTSNHLCYISLPWHIYQVEVKFVVYDAGQPFDDDSAYSIAVRTYQEMKSDAHDCDVQLDHITYATMVKVVGGNTAKESTERRGMLETVFNDACDSGRVS
jgi:hypothetical protein